MNVIPYPVFLILLVIAFYFNAMFVYYYGKAKQYKKQLEQCLSQNSAVNSLNRPYNSAADMTMAINQLKGERKDWNIRGYTYISRAVAAITEKAKPMILPMLSILKRVYHNQPRYSRTLWGKLDYLIVDLPPGTADAPLTVLQTIPVSGIVIVFSPQELAAMVVKKAVRMAKQMNIPILGVVENMSYFTPPGSRKKLELFGKSRGQEMSEAAGAPLLAQIPIDPELAKLCDQGKIERYSSKIFDKLSRNFIKALPTKAKQY